MKSSAVTASGRTRALPNPVRLSTRWQMDSACSRYARCVLQPDATENTCIACERAICWFVRQGSGRFVIAALAIAARDGRGRKCIRLKASAENCQWGFFDAKRAPVLTIKSGDTVAIESVSGAAVSPAQASEGFIIPPELLEITRRRPSAAPARISSRARSPWKAPSRATCSKCASRRSKLRQDWAYNAILPLIGVLPDDFDEPRLLIIPARHRAQDRQAAVGCRFAAGAVLRRDGRRAAAGLGPHHHADAARDRRQSRQQGPRRRERRSICRCSTRARCSPAATAMPCRAMAKSASRRSRRRCKGRSNSSCARTFRSTIRAAKRHALHHHGHGPGPRPLCRNGGARHDRLAGREGGPLEGRRLLVLQRRRRPPSRRRSTGARACT